LRGAPGVEIETVRGQGYRLHANVRVADGGLVERNAARRSQRTQFCASSDGTRLAYARLGDAPPLVKAANWLNHLELDWDGPVWQHWLERLIRDHCLVRYDARGTGLSEGQPATIRFADFVAELGAIIDAAGVRRAPVIGFSQGASVAVTYAAQNPERVSALIL